MEGRLISIDIGAQNLGICVCDISTKKIIHWLIIDIFLAQSQQLGTIIRSSKKSMNEHVEALIPTLEQHSHLFEDATHVVIEQQQAGRGRFSNNKMNVLMHCIKVWFLIKYQINSSICSPKNKLKIIRAALKEDDEQLNEPPTTPKEARKRYSYHKKRAIQCATKLAPLYACESKMRIFLASKKKDDFADSLLQALYFIDKLNIEHEKKNRKRKR